MEIFLNEKIRIGLLFSWMLILYAIEHIIPLIKTYRASILNTVPNVIMTILLVITNFLFSSLMFVMADWVDAKQIGFLYLFDISNIFLNLIIGIVFLDFWAAFIPHFLMHKVPVLWRIHSVHHSDIMVDVTTAFRQHPLETILRITFQLSGTIIFGVTLNILLVYLSISAFNSQIEHSNIRIPAKIDRVLQYFYVTPNMHKLHHSSHRPETDSNYSNVFSVWDRVFGTYKSKKNYNAIQYGLEYLQENFNSVRSMLIDVPIQTKKNQQKKKHNT